ncbi:MAG: OmpH family outer membrane protein [Bacteroidota bacterium]
MKNIILILFIVSGFLNLSAQKFKYGYINADKVLQEMPEISTANKKLEAYIKPINDHINTKNSEYQKKLEEFNKTKENLSDFLKKEKESELNRLQNDLRQFQLNAQKEIGQKKKELYQKAINKLKTAITEVAKKNEYRFIIDNSNGQLLYSDEQDNVETLVKRKLGIE